MSILDKVIAAVTPPESDEARLEARTQATNATPKNMSAMSARLLWRKRNNRLSRASVA